MALGQFLTGTPERFERIDRFEPNQISALNNLLSLSQQRMQNPYEGFAPIQEQQMRNYQQNIIPSIAERFAGLGALNSSGFAGAQSDAATNLATNLAALQSQYGLQNRAQSLQEMGLGLTPQKEIGYFGSQPGLPQMIASNPEALRALGSMFSGLGSTSSDGSTGMSWIDRIKKGLGSVGSSVASAAPAVGSGISKALPALGAAAPILGPLALGGLGIYGLSKGLNYLFR